VKRFEIRPCLDPSAEVESRVRFDAWGTPDDGVDTGAGTARFALVTLSGVEGDALVGDGDVFDSIWVAAQFDESACADGMVLELRYTTPQLGGQIEVEWEAEIQVESDFDGVATLEIVPLP
jgi:hypothetical protein